MLRYCSCYHGIIWDQTIHKHLNPVIYFYKLFLEIIKKNGFIREGRLKFDVTEANGEIDYTQNTTFVYDPLPGEESLDVKITTVNPIYYVRLTNQISINSFINNFIRSIRP